MYVLAFLLSWLTRCLAMRGGCSQTGQTCYDPGQLIFEGLALHVWVPASVFRHTYNSAGWYVSALAFCWLFERASIRLAAMAQVYAGDGKLPWAGMAGVALYIVASPTASFPYTWRPLIYVQAWRSLHVYFTGAMLAAYLHSRAQAGLPPFRFAATLALLSIIGIFSLPNTILPRDPPSGSHLPSHVDLRDAGLSLVLLQQQQQQI
jgi:hypothetical protein